MYMSGERTVLSVPEAGATMVVLIDIYTYIYIYIHTYIHTYIHIYIRGD